jgi:hypothetical protein
MSWIQENKFAAVLGGATLLGAIVIGYLGMSQRSQYAQALAEYQDAAAQVEEYESLPLYPSEDKVAGKRKALNTYREEIIALRSAFDAFRPKSTPNISSQQFGDDAKAANEEVRKAFDPKVTLPEGFFLGFEPYTGTLARQDATGVLSFELGAIKETMLALAAAGPSQLQNFYRVRAPEEDGNKWTAPDGAAARPHPFEITFKATKKSARAFMSALVNSKQHYFTVRTVRVVNERHGRAPTKTDAKFDAPATAPGARPPGGAPADPFGGFVLPDEQPTPAPGGEAPAPAGEAPAPPPAPAPAVVDTSRILYQVLGGEEVMVFLRVDVMEFLPVAELPAVPK